uniref:Synaptotagmin like 1 n=1 Tax=Cairina moschata TaxID=8855 RepID=A0A8C3BFL5_CAIMO
MGSTNQHFTGFPQHRAVPKHWVLAGLWVPQVPALGLSCLGGVTTSLKALDPFVLPLQGPGTPPPGRASPQNGHVPPSSLLTASSSVSSLSSSTVRGGDAGEGLWGGGSVLYGLTPCPLPAAERQPDEPVQRRGAGQGARAGLRPVLAALRAGHAGAAGARGALPRAGRGQEAAVGPVSEGATWEGAPDPFMPPHAPLSQLVFRAAGTSRPTCSPTSPTAASARPRCGSGAWTPSSTRPSRFFGSFQGLGFCGGVLQTSHPHPAVPPSHPHQYKLEKRDLQGRTLNLSVWHHDSLGRNLFLGEVEIALGAWDWANTRPEWFTLQPRTPFALDGLSSRGNLNLALKFIPAGSEGAGLPPTGELHIWVKDAQGLVPLQGSTVDAFVQCYVLPDDSKASRQKTRVVKRSLSPLFNHTMVYDGFQPKDLAEACAEFTLWHHEAFSKRQLGGVRLSLGTGSSYGLPVGWMDSTPEERAVWGRLLQQPGCWVEALLPLRTNLVPRA